MELKEKIRAYKPYAKKAGIALLIAALAGGAGSWYHHTQREAQRAQQEQARATMVAAQAEQRSLTLLDEASIRSITAEAIGQEETAITFYRIALQNDAEGEQGGRHDREDHRERNDKRDRREHHDEDRHDGGQAPQHERRAMNIGMPMPGNSERPAPSPMPPAPSTADAEQQQSAERPSAAAPMPMPPAPPTADAEQQQSAERPSAATPMPAFAAPPMKMAMDFRPVYQVNCKVGEAHYTLRIDAVTGDVLSAKA